jgi:cob(I)alamin adenosyltransferase
MGKELTEVYCGNGKGKTAMAIGQSLRVATQGQSVIIIQFLKGKERRALDFLEDLDNLDIKIFRFDKYGRCYSDLDEQQKSEENRNIMNAMNFARKVVATQECDFLVLDEILGLFDYGLTSVETVADILRKGENMHIVMTGHRMPEELRPYVDSITTLTLEEITKQNTINITEE